MRHPNHRRLLALALLAGVLATGCATWKTYDDGHRTEHLTVGILPGAGALSAYDDQDAGDIAVDGVLAPLLLNVFLLGAPNLIGLPVSLFGPDNEACLMQVVGIFRTEGRWSRGEV